MASSQTAGAQSGIITHMNKDHSDSLIRFLQHYHKVSGWRAYDAKMTDIDLNGLNIKASGKTYRIPFHPPMKAYSEARGRLVEMDKLSGLYLGKSDITIKRFVFPYGKWLVGAIVTVGFFVGASHPNLFAPQGAIGKHLGLQIQPQVHQIASDYGPKIFRYLVVIHALEAVYFMRSVLPKYSVSAREPQFWLWAFSVFIEGVGAQGRFKEVVKHARIQKQKQRH